MVEVIRIKVVEENGAMNTYYWKRVFWFVGYWQIYGCVSGGPFDKVRKLFKPDVLCPYITRLIQHITYYG